jgi:hypothetical protein
MLRQPFCSFSIAGVSITDFGLVIPSPFCSLTVNNAQFDSFLSWELKVTVVGDYRRSSNIAAFEALIYSASQDAGKYPDVIRVPVSFMFGWLNPDGSVGEHTSYQGYFINYNTSTSGLSMSYTITGFASLTVRSAYPTYNVPGVCGFVQPSAVVEGLCKSLKVDTYYNLDIDHNDAPTMINHGPMTTSFTSYVRGNYSTEDDYSGFPGLLKLSKSYNLTRDAAGLQNGYKSLSSVLNNTSVSPVGNFLKKSITDSTPQCSAFSFWVEEPTMTQMGTIHYKSNAGLVSTHLGDTLEYGTPNTNIISLSGSYSGVAYSMTNLNFADVGFSVDGSGNTIVQESKITNSWSSSLAQVYQTVNIINDVNALASQFSGDFTVEIPGASNQYTLCQPISLLVVSGNSISPITGIYNVVSVSHKVSNTFITTLKIQRLQMSSANETATSTGITLANNSGYGNYSYSPTANIESTGKVNFGTLYPTFEDIQAV